MMQTDHTQLLDSTCDSSAEEVANASKRSRHWRHALLLCIALACAAVAAMTIHFGAGTTGVATPKWRAATELNQVQLPKPSPVTPRAASSGAPPRSVPLKKEKGSRASGKASAIIDQIFDAFGVGNEAGGFLDTNQVAFNGAVSSDDRVNSAKLCAQVDWYHVAHNTTGVEEQMLAGYQYDGRHMLRSCDSEWAYRR
eukprot:TRINITY_DN4019_c0_g1_i3.p1 TRINITY_DN4019_c0_g1~~TRINITY_DN4019_c0_g1_i3.p1  ORF type:complete len:197 (+),score=26.95 TRINITY_DN4019_c0_g1_i3:67-657(+)